MKTNMYNLRTKLLVVVFVLLGTWQSADAQLLKKIGERAGKAAERTILNKTDQKVSQKVGKGIDDAVDGKPKDRKQGGQTAAQGMASRGEAPPFEDAYQFTHQYKMKVSGDDIGMENISFDYYLASGASYMGMSMSQQGVGSFTVTDTKAEVMYSFINVGGNKIASSISLGDVGDFDEEKDDAPNLMDYQITTLPEKTIAGHRCQGRQLEDDEHRITFYYTTIDGLTFNLFGMVGADQQLLPANLQGLFDDRNLIMQMQFTEKKGKKQQVQMECIELKPMSYTFSTNGYTSGF